MLRDSPLITFGKLIGFANPRWYVVYLLDLDILSQQVWSQAKKVSRAERFGEHISNVDSSRHMLKGNNAEPNLLYHEVDAGKIMLNTLVIATVVIS
jgi:hypothetical protein